MGGGYEVKEIKYMGSTIWKKPLVIIVTSIEDNKYFDKVGEYYCLKKDICALDTVMFICTGFDKDSCYLMKLSEYGELKSGDLKSDDSINIEKYTIMDLPVYDLDDEGNVIYMSDVGLKPLIDTKIVKTIVLVKNVTDNNQPRVREEVFKIYDKLK